MTTDPKSIAKALMQSSILPRVPPRMPTIPVQMQTAQMGQTSSNHPLGAQFENIMTQLAYGNINSTQAQKAFKALGYQADLRSGPRNGNEVDVYPLSGGFPIRTTF